MRRLPSLLCALLGPAVLHAQTVRAGAFVARRGDVEVSRERYRFDGRVLTADVELVGRGLFLETETVFDAVRSPVSYRVRVRAGLGGPLLQDLSAQIGDSVRWTVTSGGRSQSGGTAVRRPAAVIQQLVFSQLAAAVGAYDYALGGRQVMHAWRPDGGSVQPLAVDVRGEEGVLELSDVTMSVTFDGTGWIKSLEAPAQGLVVSRVDAVTFSRRPAAGVADTVPPRRIHEEPYLVEASGARIVGTLARPQAPGPVPVALIVPGSGAVDRNGNAPPALRSNLYAQLAWRLAERGIATLRYDKRGVGESAAGADVAMTTFDDFAEDVLAAAQSLAGDERFGPVVMIGHSEGGWLVTRAALRGAPARGIALVATPGRPFLSLLREQLARQLDTRSLAVYDSAMAGYLRGELPVALPAYLQPLFRPVNQRFTASIAAYDALAELRRTELPVLVIQGDRDMQVTPADAELLAAAAPSSRVVMVPGANHVFKAVESPDRGGQLAVYADPTAPLVVELVDALVDWIADLRR